MIENGGKLSKYKNKLLNKDDLAILNDPTRMDGA